MGTQKQERESTVTAFAAALPDVLTLVFMLTVFTILFVYPMYKFMTSSGRVEFCYVTSEYYGDHNVYTLYGARSWASDRVIASGVHSLEAASDAAKLYGCELK